MWFHKDMGNIYESGFEPAIEHAGYKPMRIDKKNDIVKIDDEIVAEIRRSRFLVADFTHGDDGAFVAMWFHKDMGNIYESGFEPAIEHAGYKPMRIDKKNDIVKIDDEIRKSGGRASRRLHLETTARVYFEAGFAFGIGIPVIFTCRKGMLEKVHFDTRQYHHTEWESAEDLRYKLKHRILALIGEGPYRIRP